MSTDFTGTNFNYYIDKKTGETKEIPSKIKKQLILHLKNNINTSIKLLKDFLIKNEINSYKIFKKEFHRIQEFVDTQTKNQANSLRKLFDHFEG